MELKQRRCYIPTESVIRATLPKLACVYGAPGTGKSTWMYNILKCDNNDRPDLYLWPIRNVSFRFMSRTWNGVVDTDDMLAAVVQQLIGTNTFGTCWDYINRISQKQRRELLKLYLTKINVTTRNNILVITNMYDLTDVFSYYAHVTITKQEMKRRFIQRKQEYLCDEPWFQKWVINPIADYVCNTASDFFSVFMEKSRDNTPMKV